MWQEAKANDKRIRELMVDHRKRAERRRAYYESRIGDPQQLIRVIGSSTKLYPDAEQFYYHENPENLMPWQANPDIKIDRFDGRSLLDFVPETNVGANLQNLSREDREMADELNFERYHDLIEAERLNVTESDRLEEVDEEWTKLLDRHQAKLALIKNDNKASSSSTGGNTKNRATFGFDYGTNKVGANEDTEEQDEYDDEKESQLLKEADILQYVDDLTDKDKEILNEMSGKYGIRSYARLLRVAKKDRDEELRSLKRQQKDGKPKDGSRSSRRNDRRRRRRHRRGGREDEADDSRYRRRHSPSYEPYRNDSDESSSSEDDNEPDNSNPDFVIEFGSNAPEESGNQMDNEEANDSQRSEAPVAPVEKKITPMEKLKLKMRAGLEKSIASNEKDRRQKEREKEREKEVEHLQGLAKSQGLPANAYLRPDPPMRDKSSSNQTKSGGRYRSPSSEGSVSPKAPNRSPSPKSRRSSYHRSRSRDLKRYRSPSPSKTSRARERSSSRDRYRSDHRTYSSRDHHRRQRSRSRSPPSRKRHGNHSRSPNDDRGRSRNYKHSQSRSRSRQRERGNRR